IQHRKASYPPEPSHHAAVELIESQHSWDRVFTQDVMIGREAPIRAWLNRAGRAAAAGVALVGLLGAGCGSSQKRIPAVARTQPGVRVHLVRYVDPAGWSVRYPSFFHRESVPSFADVALASFPLRGWRLRREG